MTQLQLENKVLDLERQLTALASRRYAQKAEEAKAEAVRAQEAVDEVEREAAENLLAIVEAMPE